MWSLRTTLQTFSQGGHLPAGFQASRGVRQLFPVVQTGGISISSLKNFLYSQTGRVVLEAIAANFYVGADGAGNWVLQGGITVGTEPGGEDCKWGAGFVFQFSRDSTGHGLVATGDFNPTLATESQWSSISSYKGRAIRGLRPTGPTCSPKGSSSISPMPPVSIACRIPRPCCRGLTAPGC
jgi:hypothetical protein